MSISDDEQGGNRNQAVPHPAPIPIEQLDDYFAQIANELAAGMHQGPPPVAIARERDEPNIELDGDSFATASGGSVEEGESRPQAFVDEIGDFEYQEVESEDLNELSSEGQDQGVSQEDSQGVEEDGVLPEEDPDVREYENEESVEEDPDVRENQDDGQQEDDGQPGDNGEPENEDDDGVDMEGQNFQELPADWQNAIREILRPQLALPPDVVLGNLLDRNCEKNYLLLVLNAALNRGDQFIFETACSACLQQYDPDEPEFVSLLEATLVNGQPAFFEALLSGQCKGRFGNLILTYLPNLSETFLAPALRHCSSIIPRHAVEVWREDRGSKEEEAHIPVEEGEIAEPIQAEPRIDWNALNVVTGDLHTYIHWPHKASNKPPALPFIAGVWAEYSLGGEGSMSVLSAVDNNLLLARFGTCNEPHLLGLASGPLLRREAFISAATPVQLHDAVNHELYNSEANGFRCVACTLTYQETPRQVIMNVERLNEAAPMLLVYRSGELVHPSKLLTYSEGPQPSMDNHVWAQPKPAQFLPISIEEQVILQSGDVIVLAPVSLQLAIKELDLRGTMYSADQESLPEIVGDLLRGLYLKTKQPVSMAAAIVI